MPDSGLELRLLRTFVAVAKRRNFSRAADDLNIAQQAVSQQIKAPSVHLGSRSCDAPHGTSSSRQRARRCSRALEGFWQQRTTLHAQSKPSRGVRLARYVWPTRTARHGRQSRGFWHTLASVTRGSASNRARLGGVRSRSSFCPTGSIWQSPHAPRTRRASTPEQCGASRWELPSAEQTG